MLFPGYTISQSFDSLGTGVRQPFSLTEGMPLVAVQNLKNPQAALSQFGPTNPLAGTAEFAQAGPLPYAAGEWNFGVQREVARGFIRKGQLRGHSASVHLPRNVPYKAAVRRSTKSQHEHHGVHAELAAVSSDAGFSAITMAGHSSITACS